jgi:predicted GNAT family N-acyltransferase
MVHIRRAEMADAAEISALILGEASHITLRPDGAGAEAILASMQVPAIEAHLASSRFSYWVSCEGNHINGVIGLRDGAHLYHMFVPTRLHRNGIASRLWRQLLVAQAAKSDSTPITVNASPFAIPVYKSLGFEPTGERVETNGVAFIPMQFTFSISTP